MSLRVLHVIPSVSPRHGGPSFALPLLTNAIARHGAEVTVATTDDDGPGARLDVRLGEITSGAGGARYIYFRRNTNFYKISWGLARWLRRHVAEYDVIHIHALFSFSSVAAARAARRAGVPYIIRPLGVLNRWGMENRRRFVKRWSLKIVELPILRGAAAIHYTAAAERQEAANAHPDIASMPSAVIPIPIEPISLPDAAQFAARFPVTAGRRVVLFLSRLAPKKGVELLLSAFQQIQSEFPDVLLVIAGSGEQAYVASLHRKAETLGCEADILWPGFVAGEDKAALLAGAELFVLPSFSENFGVAAAEALAAGVPSILSENVAIATDAAEAGAARMVPCDASALAGALRELLQDASLRERLSLQSRAWAKERFSPESVGLALMDLYRRVVPERRAECAI